MTAGQLARYKKSTSLNLTYLRLTKKEQASVRRDIRKSFVVEVQDEEGDEGKEIQDEEGDKGKKKKNKSSVHENRRTLDAMSMDDLRAGSSGLQLIEN